MEPPKDKWNIVLLVFILHGIGTLMPWNMFITAKSYFVEFKLGGGDSNSTSASNYAANFLQYHGFAAQIPNVVFNWLNVFLNLGGDLTTRMAISILVELFIFVVTVLMAMVDSTNWPGAFFWITMVTVVVLNMASAVYQNTIFGMVATFPFRYTGAVILGCNICGLFVSLISIGSNYIFPTIRTAAIYYFITAMVLLLFCYDTFFAIPLNKFFIYNQLSRKTEGSEIVKTSDIPYWTIFKTASMQLFNVFLIFFVTLAVFPAVNSDIKASSSDFFIKDPIMYIQITCFLTFNLFAMLGSLTSYWIQWPGPKYLVIPVALRLVFIPLFLFCNYLPLNIDRSLPVLINNDWIYWIIGVLMAYTSGYYSALAMMYAPQTVEQNQQVKAGMFAGAMLISGIFCGILFSFITPYLV
ncbi:PREDICTED: equilibrative nucleoside transporter 2-like [Bactrocera latifrons]|uniref:Equilibrative nucleoside transporter 3 n=1 Tax=Bactrocera latifrons TaxID=174628 RepID=A0A0K8U2Y8_BACLA|nr:PREDICTED: equilibrative nucleoside transporter 2-like [Bactrocera latifrons]